MFEKLTEKFDKNKFILIGKLIFVFVALVLIVNLFSSSFAKYESDVDVSANAQIAFFVIDQGTYEGSISITGLEPSTEPQYYSFYVRNYNSDKRADVDLDYTITFETTTNLPLQYEIIKNETYEDDYTSIISNSTVRQDDNDVYYKVFESNVTTRFAHTANQEDRYILKVVFPESYKNSPDTYQGMIELFSIIIRASQVA